MLKKGWHKEPARHSLAARGLKTTSSSHSRCVSAPVKFGKTFYSNRREAEKSLDDLKEGVRDSVREAIDYIIKKNPGYSRRHIEETINDDGTTSEITNSSIPIYTSDIMELAQLPEIYSFESELGPAFDGTPTLENITAGKIYEVLEIVANDEVHEYLYKLEADGKFNNN